MDTDRFFQFRALNDESLGQYLRRLRELCGLSMNEVVRRTRSQVESQRISLGWLSKVERDQYRRPSPEKFRVLAQLYQIPPVWILEKAGVEIIPNGQPDSLQEWPTGVRLLALRASELSPAGLQTLMDMAQRIKQYEEQVGGESKDTQPHAPAP